MTSSPSPLALVAEDEPLLAESLITELRALWPGLRVLAASDGPAALALALDQRPQLCFLDIRMPGLSGLEVAQALAEDWPEGEDLPLLVFVTAYDQYALQAFEVQAVDYLVKPLTPERLAACVGTLRRRLADRAGAMPTTGAAGAAPTTGAPGAAPAAPAGLPRATSPAQLEQTLAQLRGLLAQAGLGAAPALAATGAAVPRLEVIQAQAGSLVHFVPVDEVLYFEAADKYVRVVTAEREHLIRLSLRELLPQLDEQRFWQVHRGTVVQARAIATARREESGKVTLTLRGRPEKLTASRLYAHRFRGL